jgi:uncharacterized membrane protein YvbJ
MLCPNCNSEITDGSSFCPKCGKNVNTQVKEDQTGNQKCLSIGQCLALCFMMLISFSLVFPLLIVVIILIYWAVQNVKTYTYPELITFARANLILMVVGVLLYILFFAGIFFVALTH